MKLIALPFAGGSKYSYNYFEKELSSYDIELIGVQYFNRFDPNANDYKSIEEVADEILLSLRDIIDGEPYVIYGHSMGALVGYLMCIEIEKRNWNRPLKLVVSGRNAPRYSVDHKTYTLSSEDFWIELDKLGGLPKELIEDKGIRNMIEPGLRKDFECVEKYSYTGNGNLNTPIDVFYGSQEGIRNDTIVDWKQETSGKVNITRLEGNHFFIFEHKQFFSNYFTNLQINAII